MEECLMFIVNNKLRYYSIHHVWKFVEYIGIANNMALKWCDVWISEVIVKIIGI